MTTPPVPRQSSGSYILGWHISARLSKNLHALAVGVANGCLSYLAGIFSGGHLPAWRVVGVGLATAGASRVVGWVIGLLNAPLETP